jgi:hypothetical protein
LKLQLEPRLGRARASKQGGREFTFNYPLTRNESTNRKKDGKDHHYFTIVENQRVSTHRTVQRTVLYLGEINDQQQAAWRKTLAVFDEQQQRLTEVSLFPEDGSLPADALDAIQVKLSGLELRRPRPFGNCWLASELWHQLGLSDFFQTRLPEGRERVSIGSWQAPWTRCWKRTSRWPTRTGCIAAWTGCWNTNRSCLSG